MLPWPHLLTLRSLPGSQSVVRRMDSQAGTQGIWNRVICHSEPKCIFSNKRWPGSKLQILAGVCLCVNNNKLWLCALVHLCTQFVASLTLSSLLCVWQRKEINRELKKVKCSLLLTPIWLSNTNIMVSKKWLLWPIKGRARDGKKGPKIILKWLFKYHWGRNEYEKDFLAILLFLSFQSKS